MYASFSFNNAHIEYKRLVTGVFEAEYRIIRETNLRFHLQKVKFWCGCMLLIQNEKQPNHLDSCFLQTNLLDKFRSQCVSSYECYMRLN